MLKHFHTSLTSFGYCGIFCYNFRSVAEKLSPSHLLESQAIVVENLAYNLVSYAAEESPAFHTQSKDFAKVLPCTSPHNLFIASLKLFSQSPVRSLPLTYLLVTFDPFLTECAVRLHSLQYLEFQKLLFIFPSIHLCII